ncbi:hypothetical protein SLS60_004087 [Paraconiothyrium brasiliense]|uniref:Uncharacterized protein n=1 Tax=Paraconiothyrium brasiliense TaxID=300254 RepID=A0ABR3RQG5_9PLEO
MTSTQEGLHPIPAPSTNPGDPDGHHEIPEPNYTITLPCRGCSPIVEISATGWETIPSFPINVPPAQEVETKAGSPPVITPIITLPAGTSNVVVKPDTSGGALIIGDSKTVKPGETVTVGGTPLVVHTSDGQANLVIGATQTVPLRLPSNLPVATVTIGNSPMVVNPAPSGANFIVGDTTVKPGRIVTISNTPVAIRIHGSRTELVLAGTQTVPLAPADAQITDTTVLLPITLANGAVVTPMPPIVYDPNVIIPESYVLSPGETLRPGAPPITIMGTTYSLDGSATALVINGQTTNLRPSYGTLVTTISAAPLTLWGHVYTANRAGYYSLAPGTTLVPGGAAVTVSGSVVSLEAAGTAAVIQGSTSAMQPVTAIVTLRRSSGGPPGGAAGTATEAPLPTVGKHSGGTAREAWVERILWIGMVLVGWLGIWL